VDGCKKYKNVSEADRAQGNTSQSHSKWKWSMETVWYRFQGAAGDRLPHRCVLMWRCGTRHAGWLNCTHPTFAEGVVTRRVCFSGRRSCCRWSYIIKVKNCSSYYVYQLQRVPYNLGYCGNAGAGKLTWDKLRF